jgi:hypothetical protein
MQVIMVHKVTEPLHTLGATTVVFRSIVKLNRQGGNMTKTLTHRLPPLGEAVCEAVAGDGGADTREQHFIQGRHPDARGGQRRLGCEIVIARHRLDSAFAPTGKGADFDRGFGIDRNP